MQGRERQLPLSSIKRRSIPVGCCSISCETHACGDKTPVVAVIRAVEAKSYWYSIERACTREVAARYGIEGDGFRLISDDSASHCCETESDLSDVRSSEAGPACAKNRRCRQSYLGSLKNKVACEWGTGAGTLSHRMARKQQRAQTY